MGSSRRRLSRRTVAVALAGALGALGVTLTAPPASVGRTDGAEVFVVQALPGASYDVSIDGKDVADGLATGVAGPYAVDAGGHDLVFTPTGDGAPIATSVRTGAGSSTDVVLHQPAARDGDPVVDTYVAPMKPIGPGKARVLLAHTATVPPADVRVDGEVVFTNIANGEYAEADLPAGTHTVALLPTGSRHDPILGPLDVRLPAGTITLVYAVGSPRDGSMDVVSHRERLASDGSVAPSRIETGSAGLAAFVRVRTFSG
ncbi:DUF4397 domain-containing protein [Nocardioides mangrovi]|uniref:DUF4397 domain-containing protein n=1 Tax=Nocardioides mangrovi TaxID=2874580 RepID=A0ABS7UCZ7_9ACTN|nr:DUF4397 domain-containing protein [Nocardioides mangrovi]MBZ5738878.1 DUF4397 domain-containing protein [Nocardioides mangrovi]